MAFGLIDNNKSTLVQVTGIKLLPEPMMTEIYVAIWPQYATMMYAPIAATCYFLPLKILTSRDMGMFIVL